VPKRRSSLRDAASCNPAKSSPPTRVPIGCRAAKRGRAFAAGAARTFNPDGDLSKALLLAAEAGQWAIVERLAVTYWSKAAREPRDGDAGPGASRERELGSLHA
jgi:hypothetical protein